MFALFKQAPTPVKKSPPTHALTETNPVEVELIRLLTYGYNLSEISRRTNIATSTIHLWVNRNPDLKAARARGQTHGATLRVLDALSDDGCTWYDLERRTGLDDIKLGLALCDLFCLNAVTTGLYVPAVAGLTPASNDDGHHIMDEVRLYFPGPVFYYNPPEISNQVM